MDLSDLTQNDLYVPVLTFIYHCKTNRFVFHKKDNRVRGGGGGAAAGLHAEQRFEYHLPVKAGDILTATSKPGNAWEKESKRAGKLKFSESVTEYRNQNVDLVITATGVGVETERPVDS